MRLPGVAVSALAAAVIAIPAYAADCPAVMSLSGPDANHMVTVTAHTEGPCAGSRVDLDIEGTQFPLFAEHCDQTGNMATQCDKQWTFDTTCWPTRVYTAAYHRALFRAHTKTFVRPFAERIRTDIVPHS